MVTIKALLLPGDIIQYRNGDYRIIINNRLFGINGWSLFDCEFNNDLKHRFNHDLDIINVYRIDFFVNSTFYLELSKDHFFEKLLLSKYHDWFNYAIDIIEMRDPFIKLIYTRNSNTISIF